MSSTYHYLTESERNCIGWLGGNAPAWFDDKKELVDDTNRHYGFYCTFQLENPGQSLSIFIPEDYDYLLENNTYPNCCIKAYTHPTTAESEDNYFRLKPEKPTSIEKLTTYQKKFDYSKPVLGKTLITANSVKNEKEAAFLTVGDDVFYIQDKNFYREKLLNDGYELWGYINEDGYYPLLRRTDFVHGNMPLSFGAMYLYRRGNEIIVGYWQYS